MAMFKLEDPQKYREDGDKYGLYQIGCINDDNGFISALSYRFMKIHQDQTKIVEKGATEQGSAYKAVKKEDEDDVDIDVNIGNKEYIE